MTDPVPPVRVLYVDDSRFDRDLVRSALADEARFELVEAASRADFERLLAHGGWDVVVSDFDILGFDGLQVLDAVRAVDQLLPVVILTGTGSEEIAVEALRRDAADYVVKSPQRIRRLAHTIDAAIERARLRHERELAVARLADSERRLRIAVDNLPEAFIVYDADLRYRFVNQMMLARTGWRPEDFIGKRNEDLFPPEFTAQYLPLLERAASTRERQTGDCVVEYEGHAVHLVLTFVPLLDETGGLREVLAISYDVTRRKEYEAELARLYERERENREQLEALSRRLVALQEEERRGIARELHDEVGQLLTGLKLLIQGGGPETRGEAERIVSELMQRVRSMSMDLRPALLDDLGLVPALLWHAERWSRQTGVEVSVRHEGLERRLPPEVETAAYRIAQEALTNIARHADAKQASVVLRGEAERLELVVEDAGRGFEPRRASSARGSGLTGMRERALLLGGRLEVDSKPGAGTRVRAELPLDPNRT